MPTYSYKCTECNTAFDIHQKFSDDTLTVCPNCGGHLRKVFNSIGVTFNGSGFYRTDSRAAVGKSAGEGAHSTQKASGTKKSGGSSDPKPTPASTPSTAGSTASA